MMSADALMRLHSTNPATLVGSLGELPAGHFRGTGPPTACPS